MNSNQYNCDLWNFLNNISRELEILINPEQGQQDELRETQSSKSNRTLINYVPQTKLAHYELPREGILGKQPDRMTQTAGTQQVNYTSEIQQCYQDYYQWFESNNPQEQQETCGQSVLSVVGDSTNQEPSKESLNCAYCDWLARASIQQSQATSSINHLFPNQIHAYFNANNSNR